MLRLNVFAAVHAAPAPSCRTSAHSAFHLPAGVAWHRMSVYRSNLSEMTDLTAWVARGAMEAMY